jgi:hypothetical protein
MKISTVILSSLLTLPSSAVVNFTFDYTGAGDFDSTSMAALESTAAMIGSIFNHTATINMEVTSSNANTSTLASAGSKFAGPYADGFGNRGIVGTKILGGVDGNGTTSDGTVDVNFFHNWDFDDDVAVGAFDFKSTMAHELLHAIGFSSDIRENGSDAFGNAAGTSGKWLPFDQFVGDSTGSLIDSTSFALDAGRWNNASVGGAGNSGLTFNGTNAVAANGGNLVFLYSPNGWEGGSSGSHLDDQFYTSQNLLMEAAAGQGPGTRDLSAIEIGIFRDIGFDMVPEPSSSLLILVSGGIFAFRRKR